MSDEADYVPAGSTAVEVYPNATVVLPHTGEVVDLRDEIACALYLDDLRIMEARIGEAKRVLAQAIAERAKILGTKTIPLTGGRKAVISGGKAKAYDAEAIERGLRELGMPEDRIREIVTETVTHTVKAVEAKRAAGANPDYARVIEAATSEYDRGISVTIRH